MPSLTDSLAQLSHQSEQIYNLSQANTRPAGPYTQTYLHPITSTSPHASILDLIREAAESEVRLFKFIGQTPEYEKKVEKRDGLVTPLKELKHGRARGNGGGAGEVEVLLTTAGKLVDDYRSMPRARAHITNLIEAHDRQVRRIADLERLIAEVENPSSGTAATSRPTQPPAPASPLARKAPPKLSPEEAIKAEEDSLRALEAKILPLRRAAAASQRNRTPSPPPFLEGEDGSPPIQTRQLASSPLPHSTHTAAAVRAAQTPAKTPVPVHPHIANSLVNGTTPHRLGTATINRFSPLKFIGTPRAPAQMGGRTREERGSIFGRAALDRSASRKVSQPEVQQSQSSTPSTSQPGTQTTSNEALLEADAQDETIRLPPASTNVQVEAASSTPTPTDSAENAKSDDTHKASPVRRQASPDKPSGMVEGVDITSEGVKVAIEKIWNAYSDLMRQGIPEDRSVDHDVESTVKHLYRLSISNPDPPPSPSNASSLSSHTGAKTPPLTRETIFQAYLCLLLLKSENLSMPMNEVKDSLGATARARKWEDADSLPSTVIFKLVGKKCMRIDRRGGASGTLRFAE